VNGKLFLCTGNAHKVEEVRGVLGIGFSVVTPRDLGLNVDVEEDGATFAENALKKAREGARQTGLPSLADDSGLCVDAIDGNPGVRSARFAEDHGRPKGDGNNNALLLEKLQGVPDARRTARFVCAIAVVAPGVERVFEGRLEGRMGHVAAGAHGFGYDPLFILPDGRALAELPPDEKNALSHRSRALAAARETLQQVARGKA
jgi:XTP/dITP diphosphohydrolase